MTIEITEFTRAPERGFYISDNGPSGGKFVRLDDVFSMLDRIENSCIQHTVDLGSLYSLYEVRDELFNSSNPLPKGPSTLAEIIPESNLDFTQGA